MTTAISLVVWAAFCALLADASVGRWLRAVLFFAYLSLGVAYVNVPAFVDWLMR